MILSKRLEAVATLVDVGARVIDVGCDHAYLDIYLTLNNNNKCLATDINSNALYIAKKNIQKYELTEKIKTKLTNGLTGIYVKRKDNIVISGMGVYTILSILKTNRLSDTLIISSNNYVDKLRKEVIEMGYMIDSEIFLFDHDKPYIIIKFIKGRKRYSKKDIEFGPILKNNKLYVKYVVSKYKSILNKIPKKKVLLRLKYRIKIWSLTII